jgi:hypothetical protein
MNTYVNPDGSPGTPPEAAPTPAQEPTATTTPQDDATGHQANAGTGVDNTGEPTMQDTGNETNPSTTGTVDIGIGDDQTGTANAKVLDLGLVDVTANQDGGDVAVHVNGDATDLGLINLAANTDGGDTTGGIHVGADLPDLGLISHNDAGTQTEDAGITITLAANAPADTGLLGADPLAGVDPLSALHTDPLTLVGGDPLSALDNPATDSCLLHV